ncbi:MAG TPA: tetratricopeptide repeat protein, partial [Candidatus Limnocylindria bacterium]|nr:tetratricopeptide repeat protein [Candidatus Limnocylindria bacterium]
AGVPEWIATNQWAVAEALEAAGDLAGARAALEASVRALDAALLGYRAEARTQLARTLVTLGELGEARRQAELARAEVGPDDTWTIATARWALAAVCAAEGRPDDAGRLYQEARERIGSTGYRVLAMDIQRDSARFLIETGRPAEARPLLEEVRAFYDTPETPFERERTDALLQRCAAVTR